MFRRILAAVDGSSRAAGVLKVAVAIAERFDGVVHLYRAVEVPAEIPAAAANVPDGLVAHLEAVVLEELKRLAGGHQLVQVEPPAVLHGRPWRDILAAAEAFDADLIVIGSHGWHGWDRLLGTNAGAVAGRAGRNVLVVHAPGPG